jgi:hypothetical protein
MANTSRPRDFPRFAGGGIEASLLKKASTSARDDLAGSLSFPFPTKRHLLETRPDFGSMAEF